MNISMQTLLPTRVRTGISAPVETMTSREIAELTGKAHPNVIRDIRNMLAELDESVLSHVQEVKDARQYTDLFVLPKRETLILVSGYSVVMRAKIIDRWQELEGSNLQGTQDVPFAKELPKSYIEALEQLLTTKKSEILAIQHVAELEVVVAEQTVKVEAFDRFATHVQGSLCIRDAAKNLQVAEGELKFFLFDRKWVYNRDGTKGTKNPLAFSVKLSAGLLEHKISSGASWMDTQVRITPKGLAKIAETFYKESLH